MFTIPTTDEPRLSQAEVIKNTVESPYPKKIKIKKERKVFKQVSLLLDKEQYEQISEMADNEERSMTYIVKKFLENKGFFDD
jgi:hypothetical protein